MENGGYVPSREIDRTLATYKREVAQYNTLLRILVTLEHIEKLLANRPVEELPLFAKKEGYDAVQSHDLFRLRS